MSENAKPTTPNGNAPRATERRVTVLIVVAERSVRSVTQRMLERRGFRTLEASDGSEALALFHDHVRDITGVVLDLGMPGLDAEAIFSALRGSRSDLPILFTGGYCEEAVSARLVGAAGTDFLPRPFGLGALAAKAGDLFGSGHRSAGPSEPGAAPSVHEGPL